jgi:hypothetical protein
MSYFLPSNSTRTAVVRVCHVITGTQRRVSTHQATHTQTSSPSRPTKSPNIDIYVYICL